MNYQKVKNRILLLLFCVSAMFGSAYAQPLFEHITSDDGLSENVVNCIFQDSRGFMWFGTNDGLSKYDGFKFTIYKPNFKQEGAISSNLIFAISEDLKGNIWLGTTGSGVCKFSPDTERFTNYSYDPNDDKSLSNNYITTMFADSKGRIWIGTHDALNVIDPLAEELVFHRFKISKNVQRQGIKRIREDKKGNIWIACVEGLFMSYGTDEIEHFSFERRKMNSKNSYELINDFAFDHHNRLVVLKMSEILYQNEDNVMSFTSIDSILKPLVLIIDGQNKIWVGSDSGLNCYEQSESGGIPEFKHQFTHDPINQRSLSKNLVNSLYQDKTGIIWVGVNGAGLNKFNPNRKAFNHIGKLSSNTGSNEKVRAVLEDSFGRLWVGTEGDGLFWTDTNKDGVSAQTFSKFDSRPTRPFALAEISKGDRKWLYVGSEDAPSLTTIEITKDKVMSPRPFSKSTNSIFSILQDRDDNVWLGTYNGGLIRWKLSDDGEVIKQIKFTSDSEDSLSLSNNIIRKVFQDSRGNIWVGTGNGLNKISADQINNDKIEFEVFKNIPGDENSLSHNYILDILESASGEIWAGTFGGGLNKLVRASNGKPSYFEHFMEENGLSNNTIKSMLEDMDGKLWLSSNKGLTKLNPKDGTILNFNLRDGLQANEFSEEAAFYRKNGEMIFGGPNGFNIFYPEKIENNVSEPEVLFTELQILNKTIEPQKKYDGRVILDKSLSFMDEIELEYKENNFSIEFAALDYTAPQQIRYSYKLEGFDANWNSTSFLNRFANYTHLPNGKYTLNVKASNTDGIWNDKVASLKIIIHPPIWRTWYAYLFYLGLFFLSLWMSRKYDLIGIQEKQDLRMAQLDREKREEVHNLKLRFFTNISHELRTPLTLIVAPLENLIKQGANLSSEKISEQYHLMYKNSKYLLRLVDQLLDFRKLDQGKLNLEARLGDYVKFVKEATQPFQFIASKQNVEFKVISEEQDIFLWFDPDVVEKILYNLLSNAFKFTPQGGQITIRLSEVEKEKGSWSKNNKLYHYLQMEIIDSGKGFSPKIANRIFERFYKEGGDKFTSDGAGIGLSFTQSLVKRHYGEIDAKSKLGEGSVFIVKFPMTKSVFAKGEILSGQIESHEFKNDPLEYFSPEKPEKLPEIEAVPEIQGTSEQLPILLFVDDNRDIRKFIKSGFENDFRIIEAENGEKGLEVAKSSLPDIIISDIMMPKMDGIEMCKVLKAHVDTSHIPIVLLTAKTTSDNELKGLETGADAFVRKPFQLDILKLQILNIYNQREKLKNRFRKEAILQPKEITVTTVDEEFLQRAMNLIEDHMSDAEFNVEALVKEMFISRSKLYLKIKALTGYSTSEFIRTVRLKRAVQLLEKSDYTIKEIMFMTGFNTASYFSKCFKKLYGIVPSEYVRSKREQLANEKKNEDKNNPS